MNKKILLCKEYKRINTEYKNILEESEVLEEREFVLRVKLKALEEEINKIVSEEKKE